jgi:hypothetical protein
VYTDGLLDAVRKCDVVLAIIGPGWGTAPQLADEADWVRKEILTANSLGTKVVPVLKGRKTDRLVRDSLPPELRWLADVQSHVFDIHQSTSDLKKIGDFIAGLIPALKKADRTPEGKTESSATNNSATDVTGNVNQARDVSGGMGNVSGGAGNVNLNGFNGQTTIGDQNTQNNNFLTYIYDRIKEFKQLTQPIDHLRRLATHFLPPPGFDAALDTIKDMKTVIIAGPPGSGRTATAKMLVFSSWSGKGVLHELDLQASDDGLSFHIDADIIGHGDGTWMDLSEVDLQQWIQIKKQLPALQKRVQERDAHLVIIQPNGLELPTEFRPYLKQIGRPPQSEVFAHLLRAEGFAEDSDLVTPEFLKNPRPVADVSQFVADILSAKEQSAGEGDLKRWIAAAEEPTSPRETRVSEALHKLPRSSDRALLLAVAMLHGAHADVIDRAAVNLLARLPGETDSALERPPLGLRLRKIGAEIDTARHVRFTHSGYETAIRTFFWRHFPGLHEVIFAWATETLDSNDLSDDDRRDLARGLVAQCLDDRYRFRWRALVEHLTAQNSAPSYGAAAAAILQMGLDDEANSRAFRRQIYDWSTTGGKSGNLATVLVAACQQMSATHPAEALVRLHHVARRYPPEVGARDALTQLARSKPWLLTLLFSRLTRWNPEKAWKGDAAIFLDLAVPVHFTDQSQTRQKLIAQEQVAQQLAAGWALAFVRLSPADWAPRANDWLSRAAEDDANRHLLIGVLIDGARRAPGVLPQLYGLACHGPFSDIIADPVLTKISAIQGVELP